MGSGKGGIWEGGREWGEGGSGGGATAVKLTFVFCGNF